MSEEEETIPKYLTKSWNSLNDLRAFLEREELEEVVFFNGIKLVTNKYEYLLYDNVLQYRDCSTIG